MEEGMSIVGGVVSLALADGVVSLAAAGAGGAAAGDGGGDGSGALAATGGLSLEGASPAAYLLPLTQLPSDQRPIQTRPSG